MEYLAVDKINENGVGLVPPQLAHFLYEGLHSRLHSLGIDGVKVDVINEYGGRIEVSKAYFKALTASIKKYFKGYGVIARMDHSNDFMFLGTQAITLGSVGGDVEEVEAESEENSVRVGVRGSREMRVYTMEKLRKCKIDGEGVEFGYVDEMVSILVPWPNFSPFFVVQYLF